MTAFAWQARDPGGRSLEGVEEARDATSLVARLRTRGLLVLAVAPVVAGRERLSPFALPVRRIHVERALRSLGLMVRAGVPILQALRTAAETSTRARLRRELRSLAAEVERGSALHEALAGHARTFPPLVRALVRAGEVSGTLDQAFLRSAEHLEQVRLLRASVLSALLYPTFVVGATVVVTLFLLVRVVPVLERFLRNSRATLHPVTRALVEVSHAVQAHWATLVVVAALVPVALLLANRVPAARRLLDRVLLATPAIGSVRRTASTALLARGLGTLVASGVHLVQALPLLAGILRRPLAAESVARTHDRVLAGETLAGGFESPAFSPLLPRLVAVGEASGELQDVLEQLAEFEEQELAAWIRRASSLIEPILTLVLGGLVGFVYLAFFLGIFSAAGAVR